MKRRDFFTSLGGLGLVAVTAPACERRDAGPTVVAAPPLDLSPLRTYAVPDGTEPALVFVPLRQPPRS